MRIAVRFVVLAPLGTRAPTPTHEVDAHPERDETNHDAQCQPADHARVR